MPEASVYKFTFHELAEMMVERAGVKQGYWGIQVNFGIAATNAGPGINELKPTAIVPILEIGLQEFKELTSLSVDAADVWKKREGGRRSRTKHAASTEASR